MRKDGMLSSVWSMDGKIFMLRLHPMVQHRESIPRKTLTTYDSKLTRVHFSGSLSLTVYIILSVLRYELGWIRHNVSNVF